MSSEKAEMKFLFSFRDTVTVFAVIMGALLLRVTVLNLRPFQSDESTYVYAAYGMTRGLVPYREIFMAHPPLVYCLYSIFIELIGVDVFLIRLCNILIFLVTVALTYIMTKMILKNYMAGSKAPILCTCIYAFYPSFFLVASTNALMEDLLTLFTLGTIVAYIGYFHTRKRLFLLITGILMGLSVITTFRAVLFVAAIILFDLFRNLWRKNLKKALGNALTMLSAMSMPFLILACSLVCLQALNQFFLHTYYIQLVLFPQDPSSRLEHVLWYVKSMFPLLVLGALGSLFFVKGALERRMSLCILPSFVLGFVYLGIGFTFRNTLMHYFFYLSPYLSLLATVCLMQVASVLIRNGGKKLKTDLGFTLVASFLALLVLLNFQTVIYASEVTAPYFRETPYNQLHLYIGRYIANATEATDKIWTSEQAIGFFAERLIVAPSVTDWPFRGFFSSVLGFSFDVDRADDMKDYKEGFLSPASLVESWEEEQVKAIVFIHGQGWVPYPDDLLWNGFRNQTGVSEYVQNNYELRVVVNSPGVPYLYRVWVRK